MTEQDASTLVYRFKKGDKIQIRTSPRVYIVTHNETRRGSVHCERKGRKYVFRSYEDDVSLWNGIEEDED